MEAGDKTNLNNYIIDQNNINNLMFNGQIQSPMNQMNNPMFSGIMQNNMNNMMFNGMMSNQENQMYYLMLNGIFPNNMNNIMFNCMTPNNINNPMINGIMQNPINNLMSNGNIQNPIYNSMMNGSQILNQNNNNNIQIEENIPIENSIKLECENNESIQYYLYPEIVFSEEESNNSKVLLIIGQTGHGKTTFVNALVNIYSGITINDKFRYLLVKNENKNQLKSITKEITIYKIRPRKNLNYPPLIIIDTPGFGDTEGVEGDKQNLMKFREFFDSKKINNINCILYIIIGANSRFGENDKNIINYLLNLFSKNVKDNFIVGVTNFIPESKKDIPNIIKSLSDENHFYYQNVLKSDNISKEQLNNLYWYFTSDNKIISNNEIEGNSREREKWQYTENQIKYFIENKIKILEKKNIEDSQQVLDNRFQLENEIKCFSEKIDSLISKKLIFESNMAQLKDYQDKIIIVRDKMNNNNFKLKNISQILKEIKITLPYMKKIMNKPAETKYSSLICEKCQLNCHKNCNCILTELSEWFCGMISFNGKCKICNHNISSHKKVKYIYTQKEEKEQLINNDLEDIKNYINFLSKKEKDETYNMIDISEDNNILRKTLNNLNLQIKNCNKEIEKVKTENIAIEKNIIMALKKIKTNLDFLRKNA